VRSQLAAGREQEKKVTREAKWQQARSDREQSRIEKRATGAHTTELRRLRDGLEQNPDLTDDHRRHLRAHLDRLIEESERPEERKAELTRRFREEFSASSRGDTGVTEARAERAERAIGRLVDHGGVLGLDANVGTTKGESAMLPASHRKAGSAKVGAHTKGAIHGESDQKGSVYELEMTVELMDHGVEAEHDEATPRTVTLDIRDDEDVVLGQRFDTQGSGRSTVEGDTVIYRQGQRIAVDSKFRTSGDVEPREIAGELAGVVQALVEGTLDDWAFVSNRDFSQATREQIRTANEEISWRVEARNQELRQRVAKAAQDAGADHPEEPSETQQTAQQVLSLDELSVYQRQVVDGHVPAVWMCSHVEPAA
jgi:hypothetical protein